MPDSIRHLEHHGRAVSRLRIRSRPSRRPRCVAVNALFGTAALLALSLSAPPTRGWYAPGIPGASPGPHELVVNPHPPIVPGRIVIKYREFDEDTGAPEDDVEAVLAQHAFGAPVTSRPLLPELPAPRAGTPRGREMRARLEHRHDYGLNNIDVVTVPIATDLTALCQALRALPGVEYAHPDYLLPWQFAPNDPFFSSSDSWGQGFDDLYGPKLLDCAAAWDISQGQSVIIAVVDSGVDHTHPDIAANMWVNTAEDINGNGRYDNWPVGVEVEGVTGDIDEIDNDGNGYIDDVVGYDFAGDGQTPDGDPLDTFGHGTHVAGTIAAVGDNGIGIIGVAPQARIMALKVGADMAGSVSTIAATEALVYLADNGAAVSNSSWGGFGNASIVPELKAAFDYAVDADVLNVVSAGNANSDTALVMPANFGRNLVVAATDHEDLKAPFSNYGLTVDVSAPGGGETQPAGIPRPDYSILSLAADDSTLARLDNGVFVVGGQYLRLAGTSMAAPHAAGAAALLRSAYLAETWQDARARLKIGADPIDELNPDHTGLLGAGRVNALQSLSVTPQPLLELVDVLPQGLVGPDRVVYLVVSIHNAWLDAEDVQLTLAGLSPLLYIDQPSASLGDLAGGATASNAAEPFQFYVWPEAVYGETLPFELTCTHTAGTATFRFGIPSQLFQNVISETGLPATGYSSVTLRMQDLDDDNYPEILLPHAFTEFRLMHNEQNGTFIRLPLPLDVHSTLGLEMIDLNDDGLRDLLAPGNVDGRPESQFIFRNLGDGQFAEAQHDDDLQSAPGLFNLAVDFDDDRLLDIVSIGLHRCAMLHNEGGFSFTDVSPVTLPGNILGENYFIDAALTDFDNDGAADIISTGAGGQGLQLYRNRGDGTYEDATPYADVPFIDSQDLAVGDFNNDGWIDIFAGDYTGEGPANRLLQNNGDGTFSDVTADAGAIYEVDPPNRPSAYRGSEAIDYDNDGWLDIFVQCGDYETSPYARLYRNNGSGVFADATDESLTLPSGVRYTAAYADYDNDGDVDIYLSDSIFGTAGFYRNYATSLPDPHHWLKIRLVGTASNRDAFGARVTVVTPETTQMRDVTLSSRSTQPLHFGLGDSGLAQEVIIRWPSGLVQRHRNIAADRTVTFTEGRFTKGDADGDGDIDLSDFSVFATCYGTYDAQCLDLFDFNADGRINLGDFSTFAVLFTSSTYLFVDAGPAQTIYINESAQLGPATVSGGRGPYSYSWEPADTLTGADTASPVAAPLETTTYTLTVTDAQNQTATDPVLVRVLPMTVDAGEDIAIYSDETTTLGPPTVYGGIPPYAYSWLPTDGLDQPDQPATGADPTQTTAYTLTVTDSANPPHVAEDTVRIYVDGIYQLADMNTGVRGWTILGGSHGDDFGAAVVNAGDVNNDGWNDLLIGAPGVDVNGDKSGAAYVVLGGATPPGGTLSVADLDGSNGFALYGAAAGDQAGWDVCPLGDVNDDGADDFAVAAPAADPHGSASGVVYVLFGKAGIGAGGAIELAAVAPPDGFVLRGTDANDNAGTALAAGGDLNDDGIDDIVVGAPKANSGGFVTGAAYVIFGDPTIGASGVVELSALDGVTGFGAHGVSEADRAGISLAGIADANGDSIDDLLIGAYGVDATRDGEQGPEEIANTGAAYVLFGGAELGAGGTIALGVLDGSDGFIIIGREESDYCGERVSAAGDFNNDTFADLLIAAPYADPNGWQSGQTYLLYGGAGLGASGTVDLIEMDAMSGVIFNGAAAQDYAGWGLAGLFDVNDDGHLDLALGAPLAEQTVFRKSIGISYALFGGPGFGQPAVIELADIIGPNGFQVHGVNAYDDSGGTIAAGDFSGDGIDDLAIGADSAQLGEDRPGAVYVVFGK